MRKFWGTLRSPRWQDARYEPSWQLIWRPCANGRIFWRLGSEQFSRLLSASVQQSAKMLQYLNGIFAQVPALKALVIGQTVDGISLSTSVDIECSAANFRTIRGGTAIAVIADEVAFWRNENSWNPDAEILNAARPMLATTGGPLICNTSPYARKGETWNAYKRDFGPNGDPLILVAQADSRTMNPDLSEKVVARAYERDQAAASAEYGANFRTDIESFVSPDVVDAATPPGRIGLPRVANTDYVAFIDAAGGSGGDSMTVGISHAERAATGTEDIVVLDAVREVRPPFSPDSVVDDFVKLLAIYHIREVTGDRWGGEFVREQFEKRGVAYKISERTKSEIYKELLPLLNSGRVELLDLPRLRAQLCGLERRTARGGRDSIDHPPGSPGAPAAHDDVINAAAGALVIAAGIGATGRPMNITPEMIRELEAITMQNGRAMWSRDYN